MPNKTITVLTAPARVVRMEFYPQADGTVIAKIGGQTTLSDGTPTSISQYETTLANGNAIATSVQTLAAGAALAFWKTQEGL
jgi:TPP-dependent pyruvate/acetoin dehydrogenase alpha subunit